MELYTLQVDVDGQRLTLTNEEELFSGDKGIDFIEFTFNDDKWSAMTTIYCKMYRFGEEPYKVELVENKAQIEAGVMQTKGYIYFGLFGTDGEVIQTSSIAKYNLPQGIASEGDVQPPSDIYEKWLEDLDAYQTAVSELASIESGLTTAETTVANLESRVTVAETTVSDMEDTVDGLVSDVNGMRTTVDGLLTDVTNLQTSVTALGSAVPTLQSSVTNLESRLTAISTSVGSLEDRLATVQTSLTDLEDGLTDAEGRLTTIGNQITDAQTDIEEIETAIQQDNIVTDVTGGGVSFVNNNVADLLFMTVTDTATGSIATFPDGSGLNAVSTEIQIEPVQDLNGYDKPWTGGGGTNQWDEEWELGGIDANTGQNFVSNNTIRSTNYIPVKGGETYRVYIGGSTSLWLAVLTYDADKNFLANAGGKVGGATFTVDSNVAYIRFYLTSNYGTTYKNDIAINYPSTVTTYSPYENICPISGFNNINVKSVGKNLLSHSATTQTINGVTFTVNDDGTISLSGTATQNTNYFLSIGARDCPNGTFTLSGCPAGGGTSTYYFRIDNAIGGRIADDYGGGAGNSQFTITNGKIYTVFINVKAGVNTNGLVFRPMIELGTTATTYEPYNGISTTINLGQTVYGATIYPEEGRGMITMGTVTLDGVTPRQRFTGAWGSTSNGYAVYWNQDIPRTANAISDKFFFSNYGYDFMPLGSFIGGSGAITTWSFILPSSVTSINEANAWLAENPTTVCYELATPIEFTFPAVNIPTLNGTNNMWADSGDLSIEYIANLKDYIAKVIS